MTLIDSADSILMLYSYSGFPDRSFAIFERPLALDLDQAAHDHDASSAESVGHDHGQHSPQRPMSVKSRHGDILDDVHLNAVHTEDKSARLARTKINVMSGLSIVLTLMSILVAFRLVTLFLARLLYIH